VLPVDERGRGVRRWRVLHLLIAVAALVPELIADIEIAAAQAAPTPEQKAAQPNQLPPIRVTAPPARQRGPVRKPRAAAPAPAPPDNKQMPVSSLAGIPMTPLM